MTADHTVKTGSLLVALLLLAMVIGASHTVRSLNADSAFESHSMQVSMAVHETFAALQDVENATRGFVLVGRDEFLEPDAAGRATIDRTLPSLRELLAYNPEKRDLLLQIEPLVAARLEHARTAVELRRQGDFQSAAAFIAAGEGRRLTGEIRVLLAQLRAMEIELLDRHQATMRRDVTLKLALLVAGLILTILLLAVTLRAVRRERQTQIGAARHAQSIVDTVHNPLVVLTHDLRVHSANTSFYATFGLRPDETAGRPWPGVGGGLFNQPELLRQLATIVPQDTSINELPLTVELPGGDHRRLLLNARKLRDPGNETTMLLLALDDITERTRAQEERDRFFNLSLDLMCIASADGKFKRVNPAVAEILGWSVEEFLARPYMEQIHPDDRAATQREVERQVVAGENVLQFENRFRHKDGSWRVLSWRSVPQPGGLMYAIAHDVTERVHREQEVVRLNSEITQRAALLAAANKELESFSYSVSHDLRAPLRHIDGFAELLRKRAESTLDDQSRRYLKTISDAAKRLGLLIDQLLVFSRMGRAEMRRTLVECRPLLDTVIADLQAETRDRAIEWRIGELPAVQADPVLLRQVWANLVGNAVKYTGRQPVPRIEITHTIDNSRGHVFCVRDNGAGFDMQYAHKLFGIFQRLHSAGEFEGTGIGLANVQRIVTRHGGRVWAEGRPGEGAAFFFSLPA